MAADRAVVVQRTLELAEVFRVAVGYERRARLRIAH